MAYPSSVACQDDEVPERQGKKKNTASTALAEEEEQGSGNDSDVQIWL